MKFASAQNNFSNGELSPRLNGRNDLKEYFNGAATVQNAIPTKEGGAYRRPGTQWVTDVTYKEAMYPFVVNKQESYVVGVRTRAQSAPALTTGHDTLDFTVYKQTFVGKPVLTSVSAFTSLATLGADLEELDANKFNVVQVNNIMVLTHTSGRITPIVVTRLAENSFTVFTYRDKAGYEGFDFGVTAAFPRYNSDSGSTITVTNLTSATVQLDATDPIFHNVLIVGSFLKIKVAAAEERIYRIVTINSMTQVVANMVAPAGATGSVVATPDWCFESWNADNGYPKAVTLYQERLIFGGTDQEPNVIWCSVTDNLYIMLNVKLLQDSSTDVSGLDYYGAPTDADAFMVTLATNNTNSIQWLASNRYLQVGTLSAEHIVTPVEGKFSNSNSQPLALTFYGSSDCAALLNQTETMFVTTNGKDIRNIRYSEENGSNVSDLLTALSEHVVYHGADEDTASIRGSEFRRIIRQQDRGCVWGLTTNNQLVGLTIEATTKSLAWHKHIFGGTDVEVISICSIPDHDGSGNYLYCLVSRTIDSATVYSIEVIGGDFRSTKMYGHYNVNGENFPIYVDHALIPSTSSAGVFDTPTLNGETVAVLVKGVYVGDQVVTTNTVTISDLTAVEGDVVVGLKFKTILRSMPIQEGSRIGDAQVLFKRIETVLVTVLNSKIYKIGSRVDNTETRMLAGLTNAQLFSGQDERIALESSPGEEQRFYIESDYPFPLNISSIGIRGVTQE